MKSEINIELQEMDDLIKANGSAPHRKEAEQIIENGGVVRVSQNGSPLGEAGTIEELDELLGDR